MHHVERYKRQPVIAYPEREWPGRRIERAPVWCSVDLRDGNQALTEPMAVEEKMEMFQLLLKLGFREIEIGFPAASQIEFDFLRQLIMRNMIPEDVHIQVLTQCREQMIHRTFEAIEGISFPIVHIYNSTSALQRDVVFRATKDEIKQIAVDGVNAVKRCMEEFHRDDIILEYSPESFMGTEAEFSLEVCEAVAKEWGEERHMILNLPLTVEINTPNVYADQVEWMIRHLKNRDSFTVSVHTHNDRGTGVAATELALLAGADRVEGTLFGNGERTGNADILTLAYNMFSQGIDPGLMLSNEKEIAEVYERCTKMKIPPRHPYAGELAFTAFSGGHQDAIGKGIRAMREKKSPYWEVPYLPIDPCDIGREYRPVVRINSQSGTGGVAFIMETFYGFYLPKGMRREFAAVIQERSERDGEVSPEQIFSAFLEQYADKKEPLHFQKCQITETEAKDGSFLTRVICTFRDHGEEKYFEGEGNGPIDAVRHGMEEALKISIRVLDYSEHALRQGSNAQAASYLHVLDVNSGKTTYGVGISENITRASIRGIFSAVNRLFYGT